MVVHTTTDDKCCECRKVIEEINPTYCWLKEAEIYGARLQPKQIGFP